MLYGTKYSNTELSKFKVSTISNTGYRFIHPLYTRFQALGWVLHALYQSLYSFCELRRIIKYCIIFLFVFRIETVGKIFNKISSLNCLLKTFQSSPHDKLRDCPEPRGRGNLKILIIINTTSWLWNTFK